MLEISRMLTLSTRHICKDTMKLLEMDIKRETVLGLVAYAKRDFTGYYGYFIYVPDDVIEGLDGGIGIPEDLWSCVLLAWEHSCNWLCLDCDGMEVNELKTYEW